MSIHHLKKKKKKKKNKISLDQELNLGYLGYSQEFYQLNYQGLLVSKIYLTEKKLKAICLLNCALAIVIFKVQHGRTRMFALDHTEHQEQHKY